MPTVMIKGAIRQYDKGTYVFLNHREGDFNADRNDQRSNPSI